MQITREAINECIDSLVFILKTPNTQNLVFTKIAIYEDRDDGPFIRIYDKLLTAFQVSNGVQYLHFENTESLDAFFENILSENRITVDELRCAEYRNKVFILKRATVEGVLRLYFEIKLHLVVDLEVIPGERRYELHNSVKQTETEKVTNE